MLGWLTNLFRRPGASPARKRYPMILRYLAVDRLQANPDNARRQTNLASFEQLRESISVHGILTPLVVRKEGDAYTLIAGHRRLQAARELGLETVPVLVRNVSERRAAELAVVENTFRLDLTKLELLRAFEAAARQQPATPRAVLAESLGITPEDLNQAVYLGVLPADLQDSVEAGALNEEQAMRLADVADPAVRSELSELVSEEKLDGEETRGLVDRLLHRRGRFITAPDARHFHSPQCAFARIIPNGLRRWVYSKKDGLKLGKIACMNCL